MRNDGAWNISCLQSRSVTLLVLNLYRKQEKKDSGKKIQKLAAWMAKF